MKRNVYLITDERGDDPMPVIASSIAGAVAAWQNAMRYSVEIEPSRIDVYYGDIVEAPDRTPNPLMMKHGGTEHDRD